jgi:hypothetical protein
VSRDEPQPVEWSLEYVAKSLERLADAAERIADHLTKPPPLIFPHQVTDEELREAFARLRDQPKVYEPMCSNCGHRKDQHWHNSLGAHGCLHSPFEWVQRACYCPGWVERQVRCPARVLEYAAVAPERDPQCVHEAEHEGDHHHDQHTLKIPH